MKTSPLIKGQVFAIFALLLIVLLGFTALAIDGSSTYSARRTSQASADSAVMAGAGAAAQILKNYSPSAFYCGSSLHQKALTAAVLAAQQMALENDIQLINTEGEENHVDVTCHTGTFSNYLDIHVQITSETTTMFAKLIRPGKITSVVDALSRVYPRQNLAFGNAIASLSHDCSDGGIYLDGNSSIKIYQGGVFTNSCLEGKGNISLLVGDASIQYINSFVETGGAIFDPPPVLASEYLPDNSIDPPNCSSLPQMLSITNGGNLQPGIYPEIKVNEGEILHLNPGLYCLDGNFEANGHAYLKGDNVTIYMRSGSIKLEGTATVELSAPNCDSALCGVPEAIRGILFFIDPSNEGSVKFSGTPDSYFIGTIYAPSSLIEISGTGDYVTLQTQLIGKRVSVVGNVDFTLDLDGAEIYQKPATIDLLK
ncbi:MAG: Tad domain-containing protein [Anaerolineaceae bacterium]